MTLDLNFLKAMLRKTNYQESPRKENNINTELDKAFKKHSFKRRTSSTKENDEPENSNVENNSKKIFAAKIDSPKIVKAVENDNKAINSEQKNVGENNINIIDNNNKESSKSSNNNVCEQDSVILNGMNSTEAVDTCTFNQEKSKHLENKKETSNIEVMNNNNIQNGTPTSIKRKGFLRKDSFESIKLMLSATKDFKTDSPIIENGNLDSSDDIITTELAPGLIITGKITEL